MVRWEASGLLKKTEAVAGRLSSGGLVEWPQRRTGPLRLQSVRYDSSQLRFVRRRGP